MTRKRLAIVSSYNESCGNASYTHVLQNGFKEYVDCDVIALDLFLLQKTGAAVKHGDAHIQSVANRLRSYDFVNIQFEAGLFGVTPKDVLRRILILIDAAPNVILTMHRVDMLEMTSLDIFRITLRKLFYRGPAAAFSYFKAQRSAHVYQILYKEMAEAVARKSRSQNAWIAVHTRRERRILTELYGVSNVFDFPITFLFPEQREELKRSAARDEFLRKHGFEPAAKVVGTFGFVSGYKGYETVLRALKLLPSEYHVGIFGGQHPQSIQKNVPLDPYIASLIDFIESEDEKEAAQRSKSGQRPSPEGGDYRKDSPREHGSRGDNMRRNGFLDRVRFVGALDDPDFLEALRHCDAVVLPYLEVGQSMSGVVSLALECDANMYVANNLSMNEVRKYHGDVFTGFDIGNHVELAQKIQQGAKDYSVARDIAYGKYNLRENITVHLSKFNAKPQIATAG